MGNDGVRQPADDLAEDFAEAMLGSPRGLRFAFACFQQQLLTLMDGDYDGPVYADHVAFFDACHDESVGTILARRGPGERGWNGLPRRFGPGVREPAEPQMPAPLPYQDLADRIRRYEPTLPDGPELVEALVTTVSDAAYWGEVRGEEVLASREPIRRALRPYAREAARAILAFGLHSPPDPYAQWSVDFGNSAADLPYGTPPASVNAASVLEKWWDQATAWESRSLLESPSDPSARFSGEWWSTPPDRLMITSPPWPTAMTDPARGPHPGEPTGLRIIEDPHGWEHATAHRLVSPRTQRELRLFVIDGPQDWARLCARFPFEVSASKRHDWHHTTGGVEPWFMPDFDAMAAEFDAIHLSLRGYLSSAGIAVPVPCLPEAEEDSPILDQRLPERPLLGHTVLAGWAPLSTYWLVDAHVEPGSGTRWEGDGQREWSPASSSV